MARKRNFLKRLHSTPKIKSLRKKIDKANRAKKILAKKYRAAIKSESKRLSK